MIKDKNIFKYKYRLQTEGEYKNLFLGEPGTSKSLMLSILINQKIKENYTVVLIDNEHYENLDLHPKLIVVRDKNFSFDLIYSCYYDFSYSDNKVVIIFDRILVSELIDFRKALDIFSDKIELYGFCQLSHEHLDIIRGGLDVND